jgi:hypothetical protein
VIVADVSFIDIFWSMLWFFFLFIWLVILFHILTTCSATTRCRAG